MTSTDDGSPCAAAGVRTGSGLTRCRRIRGELLCIGFVLFLSGWLAFPADASTKRQSFQEFIASLWPLAEERGVSRATFDRAFLGVSFDRKVVANANIQAEFARPIRDYIDSAVTPGRIERGRANARADETPPSPCPQRPSACTVPAFPASASPSRGPGNGILWAETGGRFQPQNAGERPEFGSQTATRLSNRAELRGFLPARKPRRFAGGIELMAIAAWHPFKTRRRVADLVRETICRSECQSRSRANRRR